MLYKNIAGGFFGLVTKHACDGRTGSRTDGQNYDSQDRRSIAASRVKNAAQCMYFLKILKSSGLTQQHLLHYYNVVAIRPVLEYCSSLLAHNLHTYLSDQIESIQKRAIRISYNPTIGMYYISALTYADMESLKQWRETKAGEFFKKILSPTSCLHYSLLPQPRDDDVLTRLRNPHRFPINKSRKNKKHQSFINFGLKIINEA